MDWREQSSGLRPIFDQALSAAGVTFSLEEEVLGVRDYLIRILSEFLRQDRLYALRDEDGHPVRHVSQMLEYGDIRMRANSFEQERLVHRYIGDLMLYCTGMFPEMLPNLGVGKGAFIDPNIQGRVSYDIAASFDHVPFEREAELLAILSAKFDKYQHGFSLVRKSFVGFTAPNWDGGLSA